MSQELIGVISDTHGRFDPKIPSVFKGVSHILHAGDIGDLRVLRQLEQIAPVTAVWGNVDEGNVPPGVEEMQTLQLGGLRIFMIHILGNPQRLTTALKQRIDQVQPDVVVFGHSHKPLHRETRKGAVFQPGQCRTKEILTSALSGFAEMSERQTAGRAHLSLNRISRSTLSNRVFGEERGSICRKQPEFLWQFNLSSGGSMHGAIQGIALHGVAASITDQMLDLSASHSNRGLGSSHMNNLLFDDRAI